MTGLDITKPPSSFDSPLSNAGPRARGQGPGPRKTHFSRFLISKSRFRGLGCMYFFLGFLGVPCGSWGVRRPLTKSRFRCFRFLCLVGCRWVPYGSFGCVAWVSLQFLGDPWGSLRFLGVPQRYLAILRMTASLEVAWGPLGVPWGLSGSLGVS